MAIRVVAYDKSRFNSIEDALYEDSKNYQDASRPAIWYTNRRTGLKGGDFLGAKTYNTIEEAQEEIDEWVSNASINGTDGFGWAILDEKSVISKSKKLSKSFNDMVQKQRSKNSAVVKNDDEYPPYISDYKELKNGIFNYLNRYDSAEYLQLIFSLLADDSYEYEQLWDEWELHWF